MRLRYNAIHVAIEEARSGVLHRITQQLEIEHIQPATTDAITTEIEGDAQ